jgi:glycosyltransferase involved in cell wall biosynthesis
MTDFSILMPVYNEVTTVETAIARTLEADYPVENVEIVVVDDGSTDGSYELLQRGGLPDQVTLIRHPQNQGKGAAIVTALAHAKGEYVGILDADLEYDPQDLALLLRPLLDGEADAVFGTRGFQSHSSYGFWYVLGNRGVTLVANVLYNSWISDIMTCHKVMSAEVMRGLHLRERGFAVEPEITARLLRKGARIYEVPITYRARTREAGKKLVAIDGLRVLRTLIRCRVD